MGLEGVVGFLVDVVGVVGEVGEVGGKRQRGCFLRCRAPVLYVSVDTNCSAISSPNIHISPLVFLHWTLALLKRSSFSQVQLRKPSLVTIFYIYSTLSDESLDHPGQFDNSISQHTGISQQGSHSLASPVHLSTTGTINLHSHYSIPKHRSCHQAPPLCYVLLPPPSILGCPVLGPRDSVTC